MDSNKSRAAKRQLVLYLHPEEAEQLASTAEQLGEPKNVVVRTALRDYMRRLVRDGRVGVSAGSGAPVKPSPHTERVTRLRCVVRGGRYQREDDLSAYLRARVLKEYPRASLELELKASGFARISPATTVVSVEGKLKDGERAEVQQHVFSALKEAFEEFNGRAFA